MSDKNLTNESMVSSESDDHFPTELPELDKSIKAMEEFLSGDGQVAEKTPATEPDEVEDEAELDDLEEDSESEEELKKEKPAKKSGKFWHEKREKYAALQERDRLAQEVQELKQQRDEALEIGSYHYGRNISSDLDFAKEVKRKAILEGDVDTLLEADIAINKALNATNEVEKWKSRGAHPNIQPEQPSYQTTEQAIASDWLRSHPEIDTSSENYNATLAKKVGDFINKFDNNIRDNNQTEHYFSEEYFDVIDNYIHQLRSPERKSNLSKPASASSVAPVRKNYGTQPGTRSRSSGPRLNEAERKLAKNMGISEENWKRSKQIQINKAKTGR